jgi:hypothetical protein
VSVDVLITGVNAKAQEAPATVLARVLGLPPEQARRVAKTFPSMLVSGATRSHAESVAAQLREGGIRVELVQRDEPAGPAPKAAEKRVEKPVEKPTARRAGAREERGGDGPAKHRDAFEERSSRTMDAPPKQREAFEERPSRTVDAPPKYRDALEERMARAAAPQAKPRATFEERPSRTVDAPPKYRDALEERMARTPQPTKQVGTFDERPSRTVDAPPRHRDAFEERLAKSEATPRHRDALEERQARGALPQQPKTAAAAPAFEDRPSRAQPVPPTLKDLFTESPSRAQPVPPSLKDTQVEGSPRAQPLELKDSFDQPSFGKVAPELAPPPAQAEADPFARDSGFGPLDLDRAVPVARAAPGFGGLDDVFGAAADTGLRRGVEARAATLAQSEAEALFEVPSAGRPVQVRPRQAAAPLAEPRERAERPFAREAPVVLPLMAMTSAEAEPPKQRRWLAIFVALALIGTGYALLGAQRGSDTHAGAAWAEDDQVAAPADDMHVLIRMAPRGIARSMGMILRQLVNGIYKVQITTDGFPDDAQCMLVRGDDGKRQERLEKLLKTGVALELDEAKRGEFLEHQESLRNALGNPKLTFTPLCLSVDAWLAQEDARKQREAH